MSRFSNKVLPEGTLVEAENISMYFSVQEYKYNTLKERVVNFLKGKRNRHRKITVLDDLSFTIKRGESLGVIGHNGAGKSTLLKMVAGIYRPTSGTLSTQGEMFTFSASCSCESFRNFLYFFIL